MTLPDIGEAEKRLRTFRVRVDSHLKRLQSPQVAKAKRQRYTLGALLIIVGLILSMGINVSQAARVQQLRTLEAAVAPAQVTESIEVQPIESPAVMTTEVIAEKVEPTPTLVTAVAGASISRFTGDVASMLRQAAAARWDGSQAEALIILMGKESGLNPYAINKSSGACGIPQALPCSKLLNVIGSLDNVDGQIQWLLNYVASRYGTPANALAFHRSHGWY